MLWTQLPIVIIAITTLTTINPTVQFLEDLYPSQIYWFSPGQGPEKPRKNPSLSELVG